ncbi:hypothetical protein EGW08_002963 [Elysia chlorotica]|uniref:Neurotransmitter-gated ion-channel ligand-binding domain-containing protein n=1 Tax=Elysia chlorotica TaxID=188477 RepID=A0A433U621_ELYCH|nr:hypothetical protein EGW08_002963 [Elysia chlorotica]
MKHALLIICICVAGYGNFVQSETRDELEILLKSNNPDVLPSRGQPVMVSLGLDLTAIREVDLDGGEIELLAMRTIAWKNPFLAREGSSRNDDPVSIDIKRIWSPDIVAYNHVHPPEQLSPPLAAVAADGQTYYIPNERIRFRCNLEHISSPQGSNCTLKYGSWTHHGGKIALEGYAISTDDFEQNSQFDLLNTYTEVVDKKYPCCPESYPSVLFTLNIRYKRYSRGFFGW